MYVINVKIVLTSLLKQPSEFRNLVPLCNDHVHDVFPSNRHQILHSPIFEGKWIADQSLIRSAERSDFHFRVL